MSAAGKTTVATHLVDLLGNKNNPVLLLDGDELRRIFPAAISPGDEFSRETRLNLARSYSRLCQYLASNGCTVVIATISMFQEVHQWNRTNLPGYFEVYLKVPLEERRRRDPKGLYARYDAREISNVAGLDFDIDEPESPELVFDFGKRATQAETIADAIFAAL